MTELPDKVRLVVLFGGQSAEHDVSCVTAAHVLRAVDPHRYDAVPVGITRAGQWVLAEGAIAALQTGSVALPSTLEADGPEIDPLPAVMPGSSGAPVVVLPLLHGPHGEDGTVQGMLELAGVPYVGSGVLGSALCMDKAAAKQVLAANGVPQVRYVAARDVDVDPSFTERVGEELGWPVFVKPANLGSSIGVTRVGGPDALAPALAVAFRYDEWVVVEEGVRAREIECAVLGNATPRASLPGEVVASHDFYDYEDKYVDGTVQLIIPAALPDAVVAEVQSLAVQAFRLLRCDGMARVDFFYEQDGRGLLLNEVNTIPGFTPGSMYPKLWEASGLAYADLIDELVRLALERHERRSRFATDR
jgi:D-alanine-D-alanine ligase